MSAQDTVRLIQAALGFDRTECDGIPGRKTRGAIDTLFAQALMKKARVNRDGQTIQREGWSFSVQVEGDDLVVYGTSATWFGGDADPLDNGETASGVLTRGNPKVMGCALPVLPFVRSTANSPLPRIPWKTMVQVSVPGLPGITVPLIDNGPARSAGDGIDLTVAAFKALGGTLVDGVLHDVTYRVLGGAAYLS